MRDNRTAVRNQLALLTRNKLNLESQGHTDSDFMKLYTYRTLRKFMPNRNKLHTRFAFDNING